MSLKSIVKELVGIVARREETRRRGRRSHIAPEGGLLPRTCSPSPDEGGGAWAGLPPELLRNIIQRVEAAASTWPGRRDVVACASVCKTWREIAKDVVNTPEKCGRLTFPISLKQPGPRDAPIQCFIRRDRFTSTYLLYLGLSPSLSGDASKLLLAAKKIRRATGMDFRISLAGSDFCQTSNNYAGKLRSNFLGTKFTIYDSQLPRHSVTRSLLQYNGKTSSVDVSAYMLARDYDVATICYELNIFRTRGPGRMLCAMRLIPLSSIREGGSAPTPTEFRSCPDGQSNSSILSKTKHTQVALSSTSLTVSPAPLSRGKEPLVLRNKSPRWHEQLQCWCLNFKGRVTVASVKNFQLVAAVHSSQNVPSEEQEKVILQFGKIGKDIFTMDYRYPLSAFQAFAVCLSSFDTKPACE